MLLRGWKWSKLALRGKIFFFVPGLATIWLIWPSIASSANVSTVVKPNGGECLTVGQSFTIEFSWSGADIEHIAIYYRTDGQQPAHLDSSRIKHPINVPQQGTTWPWAPISDNISETGRIWVDSHESNHLSLNTWDSSDADFSVRASCAPPVTTGGAVPPTPPPLAQNVKVIDTGTSTASVGWVTDRYSYTKLVYGTSSIPEYGRTATTTYPNQFSIDPLYSRAEHNALLTGLMPHTTYYFRTISGPPLSNIQVISDEYGFVTQELPDTTPPGQVQNVFSVPGNGSALISWINPIDPDFKEVVMVRRTDRFAENREEGNVLFRSNKTSYTEVGLINNAAYYYALFSVDGRGNSSLPVTLTVTPQARLQEAPTLPELTPGSEDTAHVSRVWTPSSEPKEKSITLRWKNPEEARFLGVQIVRSTDSLPQNPYDGDVVFRGRTEIFEDTGLTPEKRYLYGIFAFDWKNNFSPGALIADSTTPEVERIKKFQAQLEAARNAIASLKAAIQPKIPKEEKPARPRTLQTGVQGEEVKMLQEILSKYPDMYPEGLITGYFGSLTRQAVQRLQIKYHIVSQGDEKTTGFGLVGPKTWEKVNELKREP